MTTNTLLRFSRRLYTALIHLYPAEHRADYGAAMIQLFSDQCREAVRRRGWNGLFVVWLRTLPDILWTSFVEQWNLPRSGWDLVYPNPNRQLPWRTVVLVLLPGLILLIGQLGDFLGNAWYLQIVTRIGFFLFIPVLLVWRRTRQFPVWGLVPLGMVFHHLVSINPNGIFIRALETSTLPWTGIVAGVFRYLLIPMAMLISSIWLIVRRLREKRPSRSAWVWGGLIVALLIAQGINSSVQARHWLLLVRNAGLTPWSAITKFDFLLDFMYGMESPIRLLFLAALGLLFSKRFGRLSVLLTLGYLLPTVIYGLLDSTQQDAMFFFAVSAILIWRLLLAVIAPLLTIRSDSPRTRTATVLIPLAIALVIRYAIGFPSVGFPSIGIPFYFDWLPVTWMYFASDLATTLIFPFVSVALGLELYTSTVEYPPESPYKNADEELLIAEAVAADNPTA